MKKQAIESMTMSIDSLGNYHVKAGKIEMLAVPIARVYDSWTNVTWTIVTSTGLRIADAWGINSRDTEDRVVLCMFEMAASAYRVNNPEEPEKVEELEETTLEEVAGRN